MLCEGDRRSGTLGSVGVREVAAPDGRLWWVKRAWVPRYRTLRERVALWFADREPHWYDAPLRWAAGPPRYREAVPTGSALVVGSERREPRGHDALDAVDLLTDPGVLPSGFSFGDGIDSTPAEAAEAATRLLDIGGGSSLPGDLGDLDIGGGSSLVGDMASGAAGPALDAGGSGGGGFDLDGDGPEFLVVLGAVVLAIVAAVVALGLLWFVVVPFLLLFVDGALLLGLVLVAGLVRVLFRRPWDVVAVEDLEGGGRRIRRWEVRGYRRAGRVRDDVAVAIATGTDPDLAVVRVLVREPRDDDPAGSARSTTEIEGEEPAPAQRVLGRWASRRGGRQAYPWKSDRDHG